MLRVFIALSISLFLACNSDRPPTGPAGKASAGDLPFPANLRVEAITTTSARLLWDSVDGATDYDISYKKVVGGKWKVWPHNGTATSARLSGLAPNTKYRWTVKADKGPVKSRWAVGVNFTTLASSGQAPTDPPTLPNPIENKPTSTDTTRGILDNRFNIELIFIDSFQEKEKEWFRDVARQWETLFYDAEDYTFEYDTRINLHGDSRPIIIPAGERIDDLRIYVGKAPQGFNPTDLSETPTGYATVPYNRPGELIPLVASIFIGMEYMERVTASTTVGRTPEERERFLENWIWRSTFQHELAHAFGFGFSHAWKAHVVRQDRKFFYTGPNAIREYHLLQPDADPRGIELRKGSFRENIDNPPSHWSGMTPDIGPIGWTLFDIYFRFTDGKPNVSRVTLGVFEDIGWRVNYDAAFQGLLTDEMIEKCWIKRGRYKSFDFRLDCNQ